MEQKAVKAELKADVDNRVIEGYAAIFDELDSDKDVIVNGAFAKTIKEDFSPPGSGEKNRVKTVWQHQRIEPIGRPLRLSEDSRGLHFEARLSKGVQRADEALVLINDEVIEEMSFGFDTVQAKMGDFRIESGESVRARFLEQLKLWEISPVTWGANDVTTVSAAKELHDMADRLKEGRVLSTQNLEILESAIEEQEAALDRLRSMIEVALESAEPVDDEDGGDETEGTEEDGKGDEPGAAEVSAVFAEFKKWTQQRSGKR